MGEILKQNQTGDRPERTNEPEETVPPHLRIRLSQVDFISPVGALRASQGNPELTLAPNTSREIWREWRDELGRRIARTAAQAERILDETASLV